MRIVVLMALLMCSKEETLVAERELALIRSRSNCVVAERNHSSNEALAARTSTRPSFVANEPEVPLWSRILQYCREKWAKRNDVRLLGYIMGGCRTKGMAINVHQRGFVSLHSTTDRKSVKIDNVGRN